MTRKPLTGGQLYGALLIFIVAFGLYSVRWICQYYELLDGEVVFEYGDEKSGPLVVELSGDRDNNGIYYLPEETDLSEFLARSGIENTGRFSKDSLVRRLETGDKIFVAGSVVKFEKMDAASLLALDIPIDINESTVDDFMLIPGIGYKTATAIVELREKRSGFSRIEDLRTIRGLGEKKLDKIRKYLFIKKS